MNSGNLFTALKEGLEEEEFSTLLQLPGVKVERIVSHGHISPPNFWYDQPQNEWVVVLRGEARLRFEDENEGRHLKSGDYLLIEAHRRHRVEWTHPTETTIWLAVHVEAQDT